MWSGRRHRKRHKIQSSSENGGRHGGSGHRIRPPESHEHGTWWGGGCSNGRQFAKYASQSRDFGLWGRHDGWGCRTLCSPVHGHPNERQYQGLLIVRLPGVDRSQHPSNTLLVGFYWFLAWKVTRACSIWWMINKIPPWGQKNELWRYALTFGIDI